jgi:hypothetical protein
MVAAQPASNSAVPLAQVVYRICVVEREHRAAVDILLKPLGGASGDALRGRVGGDEVGVGRLELAQPAGSLRW